MNMEEYNARILKAKTAIQNADYIIIGAGAGLSTAAGLDYSGKSFEENYKEFIKRYQFQDLYSATLPQMQMDNLKSQDLKKKTYLLYKEIMNFYNVKKHVIINYMIIKNL